MEISDLRMHRKNSLRKEISPSSPITFHTPGSCIRLGYCHYPWNCLLAALRTCAGAQWCSEAQPELDSFSLLNNTGFPCRPPGAPCFIGLRKSSLPTPWNATATEFPTPPAPLGLASKHTRRKAVLIWWPSTRTPSSHRGFLQLTPHSLGLLV